MDEDTQNDQNAEVGIEQLQADLDSAMNNWKRAAADFENYKRRKEGENKELVEFAREVTVAKLLPALDSLEQAFRHLPMPQQSDEKFLKDYLNWQNGVKGIVMQLDSALAELGVKPIEVAAGITKFDPHFHEAVKEVESDIADQIVMEELQRGYQLNGRVIRPSQVVISKKSS